VRQVSKKLTGAKCHGMYQRKWFQFGTHFKPDFGRCLSDPSMNVSLGMSVRYSIVAWLEIFITFDKSENTQVIIALFVLAAVVLLSRKYNLPSGTDMLNRKLLVRVRVRVVNDCTH
jgi:hypothetical protein